MDSVFLIPIITLIVMMAVSMPISVSMVFACLSYFIASHGDIGIICHKMMYNTYNSYVIIAVPLFIFMANVMNAGQVTDILFEFSKACIGKRRGALAHVSAVAQPDICGDERLRCGPCFRHRYYRKSPR